MWINGEGVKSESGETFATYNPATGEEIGRVPLAGKKDADKAVVAARKAYAGWSRTPQAERSALVRKIGTAIAENLKEFARLETLEHGTPVCDATGAIMSSVDQMDYAASAARSIMGDHIPALGDTLTYLRREPVGVCALITPWNHALGMMAVKLAQALVVGNTCVIKPPSVNSLIGLKFAEILDQLGLPAGTGNIIPGPGGSVGDALVTHPDVDLVGFTGSSETGKVLMAAGSPTLKKFIMELGGNNPVIVCEDADVDAAANYHAPRQYHNAGQHCSGAGRYYVHASVYDRFVSKFLEISKGIVMGDPADEKTFLGPVASREHRDRLEKFFKSAIEEGGHDQPRRQETQPRWIKDSFVPPTVVTNVTENMKIAREETFGR
jgi:acyl-CoA reductase-like NAD-dependent aldehyde dehydrogenase